MSYINLMCLKRVAEVLSLNTYNLIGPFNMSHYGLSFLANEITINSRKHILEFGSSLSTIFMALLSVKYNLGLQIISIESDLYWVEKLNNKIIELKLNQVVQILLAPLIQDLKWGDNNKWYDLNYLGAIRDRHKAFDMVLIDGLLHSVLI